MRTNNEVAKTIGISRTMLEMTARAERTPSYTNATKIKAVLGGTIETWLDPSKVDQRKSLLYAYKCKK